MLFSEGIVLLLDLRLTGKQVPVWEATQALTDRVPAGATPIMGGEVSQGLQ